MIICGKSVELKDCMQKIDGEHIWIAYTKEPPYLPMAIASSAGELAKIIGVTVGTVRSSWHRYKSGEYKHTRYACVRVEDKE